MTSLGDRLDWIIERRGLGSLRRLSLAAGLSHSTLANAVARERAGRDPNLSARALAEIARLGGVTLDWLRSGEGAPVAQEPNSPPAHRVVEPTPRYGAGPQVVQRLVEDGYEPRAARRAVGDVLFDEGPEESSELDLYRAARKLLDLERGRPEVGVHPVEDDEF